MILPHLIVVVLLEKSVLPSVVVLMGKAVVEPYIQVVVQEVAWAQIC